jgi:hypothetical protein
MSDAAGAAESRSNIVCAVVIGGLLLGYGALVVICSVNIPYLDDFDAILRFMNAYAAADDVPDRVSLVFSSHYDHRIAFARIASLAVYYLGGSVNFKALILIGNAALAGIIGVLYAGWAPAAPKRHTVCWFLPAAFMLLQPQYHETIFWGMAALQNIPVLFFSCAALYLASFGTRPRHRAGALILAAAAMLTSGSGCAAVIVCCGVIACRSARLQAAAWVCAGLGLLYLYYSTGAPLQHASPGAALERPGTLALYMLIFMGAAFVPAVYAWAAGACLLAWFVFLTARRYYRTNLFLYAVYCFLLLTAAAAALGRSHYGFEQALASRYRICSSLLGITAYLCLATLLPGAVQRGTAALCRRIIIAAALVYWAVSCAVYIPRIVHHRDRLLAAHRPERGSPAYAYPDRDAAGRIIAECRRRGTYALPER